VIVKEAATEGGSDKTVRLSARFSPDQHAIAVTKKSVTLCDSLPVGSEHEFATGEG
jgi:hypothetical protein